MILLLYVYRGDGAGSSSVNPDLIEDGFRRSTPTLAKFTGIIQSKTRLFVTAPSSILNLRRDSLPRLSPLNLSRRFLSPISPLNLLRGCPANLSQLLPGLWADGKELIDDSGYL
jgi:hypothetical protein